MKLRTKLILCFTVVIILIGGIGLTSTYISDRVKDQATVESNRALAEVELAGELALQLYQSLTRTQYLLENKYRESLSNNFGRDSKSREALIENVDESISKFRKSLTEIKEVTKRKKDYFFESSVEMDTVNVLINKLDKKFSIYSSLLDQFVELSGENYPDAKEFFTVTIEPYFRTNLLPLIIRVRDEIQATHKKQIASLNNRLAKIGFILAFATVGALLIAIALTFFLYRSIANPLQKISEAAKSIGKGNLDERINYDSGDELGELSDTFDTMAENLSQITVSRDYVDSIIEAMEDLLVVTDTDYNISRINSAGLQLLGSKEKELLGTPASEIFENQTQQIAGEQALDNIKSCNAEIIEEEGEAIPVSVSKGVIRNPDGNISGYVIVASDISVEKEAQEKIAQSLKEKEVLLAEVHHRVKNNLAVTSGLIEMQMWETENENAAAVLRQSQLRIRTIALVHEKLYQTDTLSHIVFDTYIEELLKTINNMYLKSANSVEINTDLSPVVLNVNQAIPCALLINEVIVHAIKYVFVDDKSGTIHLSLQNEEDVVTLDIRERDGLISKDEMKEDSLEMSLVKTLTKQLGGELQVLYDEGLRIVVQFAPEEVES